MKRSYKLEKAPGKSYRLKKISKVGTKVKGDKASSKKDGVIEQKDKKISEGTPKEDAKQKLSADKIKVSKLLLQGIPPRARAKKTRKSAARPGSIRSSIVPGKVLIILSGRYAGKRVIALKALESGTLLVTGPIKINGVPLRRVNQSNVIATSTKIDISSMTTLGGIDDSFFGKSLTHYVKRLYGKKSSESTDQPDKSSPEVQARMKMQQSVDSELIPLINAVPNLKLYLKSKFSLSKGQYPHLMKF